MVSTNAEFKFVKIYGKGNPGRWEEGGDGNDVFGASNSGGLIV